MINRLCAFLDRVANKFLRSYRLAVFRGKTHQAAVNCTILGNITLINTNIVIGKNVTIYPDVMFWGNGLIVIGDNVDIGKGTIIYSHSDGGIYIGNDTCIAGQCYIIDSNHKTSKCTTINSQKMDSKAIVIENDVWIAAGCRIIKGAIIHTGAVIGAGSLVNGEIESYSVSFGIPAKIHHYRI